MTIQASPIPRAPRRTASRTGFLARSTALSWPWNKDRLLAAPGTMPPSFADLALGVVDRTKPVIQVCHKNPLQREQAEAAPLCPTGAEGLGEVGETPKIETTPAQNPVQPERTGPLRNGNPRGNPNLAPRCGARTRRTGCPCRAPAMRNGRCRLHGGKSTGPRTEEGRARIRAARLRHGRYTAESRAFQRDVSSLLRSSRELLSLARQPGALDAEALRHLAPPDFGKHLMQRGTPPTTRSAAPEAPDKHPIHRENPNRAASSGAIGVQPCSSVVGCFPHGRQLPSQAAPAPSPAAAAHRPILLARPTPVAT